MKKQFVIYFLMVSLLALLVACGSSGEEEEQNAADTREENQETTDNLYQEIQDKGVITVGTEGTYSPFSFHDDQDNLTGYDVEVMREVAKRLDVDVEFSETQWDSMFAGLNAGRFDVVANQVGID